MGVCTSFLSKTQISRELPDLVLSEVLFPIHRKSSGPLYSGLQFEDERNISRPLTGVLVLLPLVLTPGAHGV